MGASSPLWDLIPSCFLNFYPYTHTHTHHVYGCTLLPNLRKLSAPQSMRSTPPCWRRTHFPRDTLFTFLLHCKTASDRSRRCFCLFLLVSQYTHGPGSLLLNQDKSWEPTRSVKEIFAGGHFFFFRQVVEF